MTGPQRLMGRIDDRAEPEGRLRIAEHASDHDPAPSPALVRATDPRLASAGGAAAGLMALQRSAGNAAVAALFDGEPAVQRAPVQIDEMTSSVRPTDAGAPMTPELRAEVVDVVQQVTGQAGAGAGAPQAPAQAGAGGSASGTGAGAGAVTSDGANTTVSGAHIQLAAPMTEADGVLRASTVLADTIVASTYSPGAGNTM